MVAAVVVFTYMVRLCFERLILDWTRTDPDKILLIPVYLPWKRLIAERSLS